MTRKDIELLAFQRFPKVNEFTQNPDIWAHERRVYIEGLEKAASMLYTKEQMIECFNQGGKAAFNYDKDADILLENHLQSLKQD